MTTQITTAARMAIQRSDLPWLYRHMDGLVKHNLIAERDAVWAAMLAVGLAFDAGAVERCPRCGSDDVTAWDALDLGDDSATGVECRACGWERQQCADCGREAFYVNDEWLHVDPLAACFLHRAWGTARQASALADIVHGGGMTGDPRPLDDGRIAVPVESGGETIIDADGALR